MNLNAANLNMAAFFNFKLILIFTGLSLTVNDDII